MTPRFVQFIKAAKARPESVDLVAVNMLSALSVRWGRNGVLDWHAMLAHMEGMLSRPANERELKTVDTMLQAGQYHATCPAAMLPVEWEGTDVLDSKCQPGHGDMAVLRREFADACRQLRDILYLTAPARVSQLRRLQELLVRHDDLVAEVACS
jgi:hypothetical protein